jgi:hypothetical protein
MRCRDSFGIVLILKKLVKKAYCFCNTIGAKCFGRIYSLVYLTMLAGLEIIVLWLMICNATSVF